MAATTPPRRSRHLRVCTYNTKGHGSDRIDYIHKLIGQCDVLFIQEHWLLNCNIQRFADMVGDVNIYGTSGMNENELLIGRPYGGCAFLWKKSLDCSFVPIDTRSKRIVAGVLSLSHDVKVLLCNMYMPCSGNYVDPSGQSYEDVLCDVRSILSDSEVSHVLLGGDLNTDLSRLNSPHVMSLTQFCFDNDLCTCLDIDHWGIDHTFVSEVTGSTSLIDHIIVSNGLLSSVMKYWCIDDGDNPSDHLPVFVELKVDVSDHVSERPLPVPRVNWKAATDEHFAAYKQTLSEMLHLVNIPYDVLHCRQVHCNNVQHTRDIDSYLNIIVDCCNRAAQRTIPLQRRKKKVAFWNERVAPLKQKSVFWHRIWTENGKPPCGLLFDLKKKAKDDYKRESRNVMRNQKKLSSERMACALAESRTRDLWNEVKRKRSRNAPVPERVDDAQGGSEVCDLFARKYEHLYNSVKFDPRDMNAILSDVNNQIVSKCCSGNCYNGHNVTVSKVSDAVKSLKMGKSDSIEGMFSDHIIHGCQELYIHVSFLFNCMLSHSFVPREMLVSTLVPITKSKRKSLCDSENYRSIALSSIVGKVLDKVFLADHATVLMTSDLQFGFKRKHATTQCTFVLQQVIDHYTRNKSKCFVILLDASKAFDRVEYARLFKLLCGRGLCPRVVKLLAAMYTNQQMNVRWKGILSNVFKCENGVKQGGVLSPTLFCVYFDELLCKLSECGVGCYVGNKFLGALSYADDIALLAPTKASAQKMLAVCEQFASEHSVTFNASKSFLMVVSEGNRYGRTELKLNGDVIECKDQALHLGTLIGKNSVSGNVKKAISDLYCSTNVIMTNFGHCSVDVLNRLFLSFCTSFYGSPLWDLNLIAPLELAWRKCIKKIWKLNMRTRSMYIALLSKIDLYPMLGLRFFNFYMRCLNSPNPIVQYCAELYITDSVFMRNLAVCLEITPNVTEIQELKRYPDTTIEAFKYYTLNRSTPDVIADAIALKELCFCRDGVLESVLDSNEILLLLGTFCVNF